VVAGSMFSDHVPVLQQRRLKQVTPCARVPHPRARTAAPGAACLSACSRNAAAGFSGLRRINLVGRGRLTDRTPCMVFAHMAKSAEPPPHYPCPAAHRAPVAAAAGSDVRPPARAARMRDAGAALRRAWAAVGAQPAAAPAAARWARARRFAALAATPACGGNVLHVLALSPYWWGRTSSNAGFIDRV
jgi:hypothetical protein